jgi:tRNA (guanine-N7-)-methyltransferase
MILMTMVILKREFSARRKIQLNKQIRRSTDLLFFCFENERNNAKILQAGNDMRMRKKKWAEPWLEAHTEYISSDPSVFKGKWKEKLGCSVLHVEIGMGKGDYLIHMSSMYPEEGWLGIEKDPSAAATAARKAVEDDAFAKTNNHMIVGDAENMKDWFEDGEIDVIHLNFSDPWPKKHNHKRRLSSDRFLKMYRDLLAENGEIRMKTDNKDLFEDSVLYFLDDEFGLREFSVDYRRDPHPEDACTEYETKFIEQGMPIYRLTAYPKRKTVQEEI